MTSFYRITTLGSLAIYILSNVKKKSGKDRGWIKEKRRKLERKCSQYMDNTLHISGFDRGMVLTDTSWPGLADKPTENGSKDGSRRNYCIKNLIKLNYTSPLL